jgi:hypothetical protein
MDMALSVEDGDKSYLHHHSVSTCNFSAHMELLSRRVLIAAIIICWPAFPLVIDFDYHWGMDRTSDDEDNIFAALKQRDRVRHICLSASSSLLGELFASWRGHFLN